MVPTAWLIEIVRAAGTFVPISGLGADGRHPSGSLVEWNDGALYGTTERGGTNDQGTLFRVNKDGSGYSVLANFGGTTGSFPRARLVPRPNEAPYCSPNPRR